MKTKHSDAAWGFKYGPLLGIYNATPGSSHTAELTTPAAYDWVKWYVASPGESGRGSLIETDNGDGTTTTASMTYTFPQSVTGDYVIMAVVPDETEEDNEVFYTVSVSVSATTSPAALVTCDIEGCTLQTPYDPNDTVAAALHAYCDGCSQYKCNGRTHVEEQCTNTNANGDRCTYTFWRCLHPTVPSYGPSHTCTYPVAPAPAVFTPSLSLTYNSSTGAVSLTATANLPIYGADLYVRSPGDSSRIGTKIGWTSGNSNRTTYSLPVSYTFSSTAASGSYKFTVRVYPFNDTGSGDPWGTPSDVTKYVTVQ